MGPVGARKAWRIKVKLMKPSVLLTYLLAATFIPLAVAVAAGPKPLSMDQAIEESLKNSPVLAASGYDVERAKLASKQAFTSFLPSLDTSYTYTRADEAPSIELAGNSYQTGSMHSYAWQTKVSQPLFTGFKLLSMYEAAKLGVDLARIQDLTSRLDLVLAVKTTYFDILNAQKALEVAYSEVTQLESNLKTTKDFYDVGIVPINDVLKVEVRLAAAQQAVVRSQGLVRVNISRLNTLMARPVDSPLAVEDILSHKRVNREMSKLRVVAQANRPEIKEIDLQLGIADKQVTQAQSGYYPSLSLYWAYTASSDTPLLGESKYYDPSSWAVVTSLEWNLFSWGATGHQVGQERAKMLKLKALRRNLLNQIDLEVKSAIVALDESDKNIITARASVRQAKENYRITNERFKEQLSTQTEVLDAQTLLTQAQTSYYQALVNYNQASAKLVRAMGLGLPGQAKPAAPAKMREKKLSSLERMEPGLAAGRAS